MWRKIAKAEITFIGGGKYSLSLKDEKGKEIQGSEAEISALTRVFEIENIAIKAEKELVKQELDERQGQLF